MAKSVKVDFDYMPKGEPVAVDGVGMVPNGSTVEVEEYQALAWESVNQKSWPGSGVLTLPSPTDEINKTAGQAEGELQTAILTRQEARTPEQVQAESDAATAAAIRGDIRPDGEIMVDGEVIAVTPPAKPAKTKETPSAPAEDPGK